MKQPIKNKPSTNRKKKKPQEYGMSKLETYFAKEFLDKHKVKYIYQYKAETINRFFDFAVVLTDIGLEKTKTNGITHYKYKPNTHIDLLIEIDGDYYHANPNKYNESKLNRTQKRNMRVDEKKNNWAVLNCIPILRIWEDDIYNNKEKVVNELKKYINISEANKNWKTRFVPKKNKDE